MDHPLLFAFGVMMLSLAVVASVVTFISLRGALDGEGPEWLAACIVPLEFLNVLCLGTFGLALFIASCSDSLGR